MMRRHAILHVIPHAGGGVGAVLRAFLAADAAAGGPWHHAVASLEYLNDATKTHCDRHRIPWVDEAASTRRALLPGLQHAADIVLVHWWNHPLMMRYLVDGLPPVRLVMWSHVNGLFPSQAFFPALFDLPDRFVFTSPASFAAPAVQQLPDRIRVRLAVVRSFAGIPAGAEAPCEKSSPFQAGYVGTVESVKMHPGFLRMCADADLPVPCIVAGGPAHEELRRQAVAANLDSRFRILGPVADAAPIFRNLHALAYPLSPRHYGTGENVLIEAMAFGAVPVVLANPAERAIVRHRETGLIAETAAEFSTALRLLVENPAERSRLAARGRRFVMDRCGIEHVTGAFHDLLGETLRLPKRPRTLALQPAPPVRFGSPLHLFLNSLGMTEERQRFEEAVRHNRFDEVPEGFVSSTRGTPFHYLRQLGRDAALEALCGGLRSAHT